MPQLTVAAAQIDVEIGCVDRNLLTIEKHARYSASKGASIVLFPELIDIGYDLTRYVGLKKAPFVENKEKLIAVAGDNNIDLVLGGADYSAGHCYNSLFHVSASEKKITRQYCKSNLFHNEEMVFTAGNAIGALKKNDVDCGLALCFDLRYPEYFRHYLPNMPRLFFLSAAWPLGRIAHWEKLLMARAIENQAYIVASNRVGQDNELLFGGRSMIVSPQGEILDSLDTRSSASLIHTLKLHEVDSLRESFPVLPC